MFVNCGGFKINEEKLKIIDGALTKKDSIEITNKGLAGCGGLLIDVDVFKFDEKSNSLTMKETESVTETVYAPCGGLKLDTKYFEIDKNGNLSLKEEVDTIKKSIPLMENKNENILTTNVTFESLDDFTIEVKNKNGEIINPEEDKVYKLQRTKPYTYKAVNSKNEEVSGTITTTSRNLNVVKTIEF